MPDKTKAGEWYTVDCEMPLSGKSVSISTTQEDACLSFCIIQVFGMSR